MSVPTLPIESMMRLGNEPSQYAVLFDDVVLAFEQNSVLDGVSFHLARGETKAVFGVAGSGKSTILKLTLGLIKPDRGHIYTLGEDLTQMKEEDHIGVLLFNAEILSAERADHAHPPP